MKVNISDVAKKAGVSTATVSRAFSHPEKLSGKTRSKVLDTADELGFTVSRTPGILKSGQSYRIALLIGSVKIEWFTSRIIEGLNSIFLEAGYDLVIYPIADTEERTRFFEELPVRNNVDAVIVSSFGASPSETERLNSIKVPIIGINPASSEGLTASIGIDDVQGVRMLVRHLAKLGHRNLLYLYGDFLTNLHYSSLSRPQAFIEICNELGLKERTVRYGPASELDHTLTELLRQDDAPTAVCFLDDETAIPFFINLPRCGINIPDDISIVGFDDARYADKFGLTTIHQSPRDMAIAAAKKTLTLIEGKSVKKAHEIYPIQLMVRSSTGKPRQSPLVSHV